MTAAYLELLALREAAALAPPDGPLREAIRERYREAAARADGLLRIFRREYTDAFEELQLWSYKNEYRRPPDDLPQRERFVRAEAALARVSEPPSTQ